MSIETESLTSKEKMLEMVKRALEVSLRDLFSMLPSHLVESYYFFEQVTIDMLNQSIDIIFRSAESEIEKIFLNSLILRAALEAPYFLIFTEPPSSPTQQIENAREIYHLTAEILSFLEENMLMVELHYPVVVLESMMILRRAFRNSDNQSLSELKWFPLFPKLSLFLPGKPLLHWVSY